MAQKLKSNLQPNINDALSRNINYVAIHSQVCFHRQLFANAVKPHQCITGLVGPLGSTIQSWCDVKLLTMSVSAHPVGCVHICHLLRGQRYCQCPNGGEPPLACPPTLPPPTHPLYMTRVILQDDTHDITGVVKIYLKKQL